MRGKTMHNDITQSAILKYCSYIGAVTAALLLISFVNAPAHAGGSLKDEVVSHYHGFYIEGRIGGALTDSFDSTMVSPNVAGANGNLSLELDDGFGFEIAVGKYFSQLWRADIAFVYGQVDNIAIDYTGAPANPLSAGPQPLNANGDITTTSVMFNVYRLLDMHIARAQPFIGVGIGFTNIDVNNVAPTDSRFVINDDDTVFTFAHHLGVDVPVSHNIDLTLRYTGLITTESSLRAIDTGMGPGILHVHSDGEYIPAVSAGVRVKLN